MGKSFYMQGSACDRFYAQKDGALEREGDGPGHQVQEIRDPNTGKVLRSRLKSRDGFQTGLGARDVNFKGDRVVPVGSEFDRKAGVTREYYQVFGDDGSSRGTREVVWEHTAPGEMTIASNRRVRGI